VAKHQGRTTKKGSGGANNYALSLPDTEDVQAHFDMVNRRKTDEKLQPWQHAPEPSVVLGRLQGNFIGTEFQLFVPNKDAPPEQPTTDSVDDAPEDAISSSKKTMVDLNRPRQLQTSLSMPAPFHSDDDDEDVVAGGSDYEDGGGYGSEGNISSPTRNERRQQQRRRRRSQSQHRRSSSRLSRLLLRSSSRGNRDGSNPDLAMANGEPSTTSLPSPSMSNHPPPQQQQQRRPNRRAIANENQFSVSTSRLSQAQETTAAYPVPQEEENVIITYTANLLGSRPRIMDVCIPQVSEDGSEVGVEWKRYLERCRRQQEQAALEQDQPPPARPASPSSFRRGVSAGDSSTSASSSHVTDESRRMLQCFKQLQQRLETNPNLEFPPAGGAEDGNVDQPSHVIRRAASDSGPEDDGEAETPEDHNFGLMALQNRPPWWNVDLGSFVLNFGGRVSVASVKNFQLVDRSHNHPNHPHNPNNQNNQNNNPNGQDDNHILLQFGRIGSRANRHSFTMDFQHPLSAVQAFSIAISSLQSKISFG